MWMQGTLLTLLSFSFVADSLVHHSATRAKGMATTRAGFLHAEFRMSTPSSTALTSSKESSHSHDEHHDFEELRHLLTCDNPHCRQSNPRSKCGRCKAAYYCSIECQRAHWNQKPLGAHKLTCVSIDERRADLIKQLATVKSSVVDAADGATRASASEHIDDNAKCGICLEPTTARRPPVALPQCGHVFCFACLSQYQKQYSIQVHNGLLVGVPTSENCPTCRTPMRMGDVTELALATTDDLLIQASRLVLDGDREYKMQLYRLARVEIEKMLEANPHHLCAQFKMADVVLELDGNPQGAIDLLLQVLERDRLEMERQDELHDKFEEFSDAQDNGNVNRANQVFQSIVEHYGKVEPWPAPFKEPGSTGALDTGPLRLLMIHGSLAKAYEAAGQYEEARHLYERIRADVAQHGHVNAQFVNFVSSRGLSRSHYHLGQYEKAIFHALQVQDRLVTGIHKLIALPLLAIAERDATNGVTTPTVVHGYTATLESAIKVMYQGFVYEAQWDDINKRVNAAFLQELCDKKATRDTNVVASKETNTDVETKTD